MARVDHKSISNSHDVRALSALAGKTTRSGPFPSGGGPFFLPIFRTALFRSDNKSNRDPSGPAARRNGRKHFRAMVHFLSRTLGAEFGVGSLAD